MIQHRYQLGEVLRKLGITGPAALIGVAGGADSEDLLANSDIPMLYMVDRWKSVDIPGDSSYPQEWHDQNLQLTMKTIAPYEGRYKICQGESVDIAQTIDDNSLSLVYIDGDHSYHGVTADLNAWYRKVQPGGIVAGHDLLNSGYGVKQALEDFLTQQGMFIDYYIIPEDCKINNVGFYFIKPLTCQ